MKIAILGCSGMLGSMMADYFYYHYCPSDLTYFSRTVDPKKWQGIKKVVLDDEWKALENIHEYDYIINCIGVIKQRINNDIVSDKRNAFHINVTLPHFLVEKIKGYNTKILQIATDCVFSGTEPIALLELTPHDPTDWYGKTKSWGEVKAKNFHNIRTSIVGPEQPPNHFSLMEWFKNLPPNSEIKGYTNHFWNGTTTLGFAKLCFAIITLYYEFPRLQHFIHIDTITKYDMLKVFAKVFERDDINIIPVEAPIPVYRALSTENSGFNESIIKDMGYDKPTFEDLIKELKNETKNSSIFRNPA